MTMETFSEYAAEVSSEKEGLCIVEAAKRLKGWTLHSGSIYKLTGFGHSVIVSLEDSGVALTAAASVAACTAGKYYHDRENQTLYVRTSDSVNPSGKFIALTYRLFFSRSGVKVPHDLSTGFAVWWLPLLRETSEFGVELDNQNQLGVAIEGAGNVSFYNDQAFWGPLYDKVYFENQRILIYSWNRHLPITEAKLIYRGRIQGKRWDLDRVSFSMKDVFNELRAKVNLGLLGDVVDARVDDRMAKARQRRVYGYVYGHRPSNVDQALGRYELSGTVEITNGSSTLTGTSTDFLDKLSPGDELYLGEDTDTVTIKTVDSDTQVTLTEEYSGANKSGDTYEVKPSHPKRYMNREFLVAGHALCEPTTTVTDAPLPSYLTLTSTADLLPGDPLIVGTEATTIRRVVSGNRVKLTTALQTVPSAGTTVTRPAISNVYLNTRPLAVDRDYTYSAADGTLTLDPLAEFNVARSEHLRGQLTFTNSSRTVTGSGTAFSADVKPGDWVKAAGEGDFFEVLGVVSDTELTLRTAATYTVTTGGRIKRPEVYEDGRVVLSCDTLGITDDGLTTGALLATAPQIVRDLITLSGTDATVDEASFTTAASIVPQRLGIVIPKRVDEQAVPSYRDVINEVNRSVFGALIQNEDFELEYSVLSPKKSTGLAEFAEKDVLSFSVDSSSDRIVKTSKINYLFKEYEPVSGKTVYSTSEKTSANAQYLARTDKEFSIDTLLVSSTDATIYANRWAFIFEVASSVVRIQTKLQGSRLAINDQIALSHDKLYERVGSTDKRKVASVQKASRSLTGASLSINDLANAFSRCGTITESSVASWSTSGAREKALNGFITDDYGLQNSDAATDGVNLIW